ncbi:ATP-binding protein [Kaarinaea lacus]
MSIRYKLLLPLALAVLLVSLLFHLYWLPAYLSDEEENIRLQETAYIEALGASLVPSLLASDLAQIHTTLNSISARRPQWKTVKLYNADQALLYPIDTTNDPDTHSLLTISQKITYEQEALASLHVELDISSILDSEVERITSLEIYLLLFSLVITIVAALLLDRWIRQPLKLMVSATSRIVDGDFSHNLKQHSKDEVGQLTAAIDQMQSQLEARQKETALQHRVLEVIKNAQSRFIRDTNPQQLFDNLLTDILTLTNSEYGFIGEVLFEHNQPYLKTFAITNIAWDEQTREFYEKNSPSGFEFRNMQTLFGSAIITGENVVTNNPMQDRRSAGVPQGHPPLNAFLGIPFKREDKVIGMFGIANRPEGYDETLIKHLRPIINTCTQIVEAYKAEHNRLKFEMLVREREVRMRTIVNNITEGIVTTNDQGIIEGFNPAAENLFGYLASEVCGKNICILVPDAHSSNHDRYIADYMKHGRSHIVGLGREVEGKRKDGSVFPLEVTVSEMWVEGERMFCGVMRDITERKKLDRMKDEFVSTVSHELRTPLTSIRGSLGMLASGKMGEFPDKIKTLLHIANNNSERLLLLINDLLDIEKLASGKMEFEYKALELSTFLQEAIEANQGYGEQYNVRFVIVDSQQNLCVYADRNRMMQVISNLLSNAAKFSPEGSNVEISAKPNNDQIRICVSDKGCGIPLEYQSLIFERFTQVDSSSTRSVGGTGLGLNIAKAIIEKHSGSIGFTSNPEVGTTFYVDLPKLEDTVRPSENALKKIG